MASEALGIEVLQFNWQDTGNLLRLDMPDAASALRLIHTDRLRRAIALLAKKKGYAMAKICYPGMIRGLEVLASMAPQYPFDSFEERTMTETPLTTQIQPTEGFVWFGGVITPALRPILERMENSEEPTGLVQPVETGTIKTIQWAINRASVDLFGFNALSMDDMKAAIQRDTSGDWYPEDLERKRQLYRQADTRFEQTARIQTKIGWMLIHFECQRTGIGDLVLSRGQQTSELVERPELLRVA